MNATLRQALADVQALAGRIDSRTGRVDGRQEPARMSFFLLVFFSRAHAGRKNSFSYADSLSYRNSW